MLTQARDAGVVLDYMVMTTAGEREAETRHEQAATTFLQAISEEQGLDKEIRQPGLVGRQISVDDFYGWHFDRVARRLRLPAPDDYAEAWLELYRSHEGIKASLAFELGYGPYHWADDEDPNNAMWVRDEITCTYAHAFSDPPYSIRGSHADLEQLFLSIDEEVLQGPDDGTEIWWWDGGDWADYFLAGLECWGAWVCTLRTSSNRFVAIGASSSD